MQVTGDLITWQCAAAILQPGADHTESKLSPPLLAELMAIAHKYNMPKVMGMCQEALSKLSFNCRTESEMYVLKWLALADTIKVNISQSDCLWGVTHES